jgi:hypothetical protein
MNTSRDEWIRQCIEESDLASSLPPAGFYRRFIHNPAIIAQCEGPCAAGGPEACDCGQLWEDLPWDAAAIAQQAAVRAWERVLASLDNRIAWEQVWLSPLDDRIVELKRQRKAHLAQRDEWIRQAIGESDPLQPPA